MELLQRALLAKEIIHDSQPVATSSTGLGFRSFSPIASQQSIPPASSSVFLTEDDLPPSNQLEVPQIVVSDTMLLDPTGGVRMPEVTLPLSPLQMNTAYSLLRTLRTFCCENPGVLDTTAALVQLPPVGDARSQYQIPPPASAWPIPQLPLNALSLDGDLSDEQEAYAQRVYVYHLVNSATALANASGKNVGGPRNSVQDITVGFGLDRLRLNIYCKKAPGLVVYTDPAAEDEGDLDSVPDGNYGARTLEEENERHHYSDLKDCYRQRRDRTRQSVAQLSTLNSREKLTATEVRLLA